MKSKKARSYNGEIDENFYYHEREVWWSSVGVNVGYEIDGKNENFERPVLIVRKINQNQFFGIPLTSKNKTGYFYVKVKYSDELGNGAINLSQMKVFSSKRLLRKIGMVEEIDFLKVKVKFINFISQEEK